VTSPTSNHTDTFTLNHASGSGRKILIAEVEVPGCGDVESVVIFPPAQDVTCPNNIDLEIKTDGVTRVVSWTAGQPPIVQNDLPAGSYTIRVTSPSDVSAEFEWFRDSSSVSTGSAPNELGLVGLVSGATTTVAVRVKLPCCDPLLVPLILRAPAEPTPAEPPPAEPTPAEPTPLSPFCAVWGALVGLVLVVVLVGLVASACPPLIGAFILIFIGGIAIATAAAILLLFICGPDWCRILGVIAWALKWSIVLGFLIAVYCLSLSSFVLVLVMGMILAATTWWLVDNGCRNPEMISWP
jgi:hypothetical protein